MSLQLPARHPTAQHPTVGDASTPRPPTAWSAAGERTGRSGPGVSTRHVYVDETRRAGYVVVAVSVAAPAPARRSVQGLVVPGRRRVHMHNEHARRRRAIVAAVVAMGTEAGGVEAGGVEATVYDAAHRYHSDLAARGACLGALVEDLAGSGDDIDLVIEADASLVRSDRHELYRGTRATGASATFAYRHQRAHEEPLLALPDVVAWCWARSGEWRAQVAPVVADVRHVGA